MPVPCPSENCFSPTQKVAVPSCTKTKLKLHMPVPFYTMKIKQRKIVVIQLKRIFTVSMLYRFHHGFIRLDLVIKCIKLHLSPPPFSGTTLSILRYYTINRRYIPVKATLFTLLYKRIVVAPWNTVNGNETNTTAAAVLHFKTEYITMKRTTTKP